MSALSGFGRLKRRTTESGWGGQLLIEKFIERSFAIDRLRVGPLAGYIDLLANRFTAQGVFPGPESNSTPPRWPFQPLARSERPQRKANR